MIEENWYFFDFFIHIFYFNIWSLFMFCKIWTWVDFFWGGYYCHGIVFFKLSSNFLLLVNRNMVYLCILIFLSRGLEKKITLLLLGAFPQIFKDFLMYTNMSSAKRDTFISSFPIYCFSNSFFLPVNSYRFCFSEKF